MEFDRLIGKLLHRILSAKGALLLEEVGKGTYLTFKVADCMMMYSLHFYDLFL